MKLKFFGIVTGQVTDEVFYSDHSIVWAEVKSFSATYFFLSIDHNGTYCTQTRLKTECGPRWRFSSNCWDEKAKLQR